MQKSPAAIKILLADDHEIFRDGFSVMIHKHPDVDLIGEAENGLELLQLAHHLQPDVIITDIKMPKLDGIALMKRITTELPHIGVLALTNYDEENLIVEMLEAGAKGYLLKSANKEEIVQAIRTVYMDKPYYCNSTQVKLANLIAKSSYHPYRPKKKVAFNSREREVITFICEGLTNQQMADKLFLSKRTIENHRENILEKMEVSNIAGVVIYAIKHGLYKV